MIFPFAFAFFSFSVTWKSESASAIDYVHRCIKITNDPAKCQLFAYSMFGKFAYAGKKSGKQDRANIAAIKNLIIQEQIKKLKEQEASNNWVSEDMNDEFVNSPFHRTLHGKFSDNETAQITIDEDTDDENYPDVICDKPNSVSRKGKCVCHKNHPYGDPIKTGCWGCSIPCMSGASCISQDFCRCPNFYIGDGIRNCTMHTPVVLSVKGRISDATVVVMIEDVPWPVPYPVHCRIGYDITNGTLMSRNRIECKSLAMLHSHSVVSVSWDKTTWSKEEPKLEFEDLPWVMSVTEFCVILCISFVFSCFCFRYYKKISDINFKEADLFELAFEL